MRRVFGAALVGLLGAFSFVGSAEAMTTKLLFNAAAGEVPESVTLDPQGNIYFSLGTTIQRLTPSGVRSVWATLPITAIVLGVKVGPDGCVYAVSTSLSAVQGAYVWRSCQVNSIERYAVLDQSGGPNDLAFDDHGNLYVTDPFLGTVWRITRERSASVWLSDPLLLGDENDPVLQFHACGVDGIAFDRHHRTLYLGNLDQGQILSVDVQRDGTPGRLTVFASDENLVGIDGIAFDQSGMLYGTINSQNALALVDHQGRSHWLFSGDMLDSPSSFAFGTTAADRHSAYLLSSSFSRAYGFISGTPSPKLDELFVPVPGLRLP